MTDAQALEEWRVGRVLARYCRLLDDQRWDELVDLFTADCVFETMGKRLEGPAQVRAFFPAQSGPLGRPESMHVLSNVIVDVTDDAATAESDWVMLSRDATGATSIGLAGRYRDRLARVGDDWRLARRRVVALARPQGGRSEP